MLCYCYSLGYTLLVIVINIHAWIKSDHAMYSTHPSWYSIGPTEHGNYSVLCRLLSWAVGLLCTHTKTTSLILSKNALFSHQTTIFGLLKCVVSVAIGTTAPWFSFNNVCVTGPTFWSWATWSRARAYAISWWVLYCNNFMFSTLSTELYAVHLIQ